MTDAEKRAIIQRIVSEECDKVEPKLFANIKSRIKNEIKGTKILRRGGIAFMDNPKRIGNQVHIPGTGIRVDPKHRRGYADLNILEIEWHTEDESANG